MVYHVNPNTGDTGKCRAKHSCPFGGDSGTENHFDSAADASTHAEKIMAEKHSTFVKPQSSPVSDLRLIMKSNGGENTPEKIEILKIMNHRRDQYKTETKEELDKWSEKEGKASPDLAAYDTGIKDIHGRVNNWAESESNYSQSAKKN